MNEFSKHQLTEVSSLSRYELEQRLLSAQKEIGQLATKVALLEANANSDGLTGLENKTALLNVLNEALKNPSESLLVVMLDLEQFSEINNKYGHAYGDIILELFARTMKKNLRNASTESRIAKDNLYIYGLGEYNDDPLQDDGEGYRFGGDEFVALLRNGESLKNADHEAIVRRMLVKILNDEVFKRELKGKGIENFGIRAGYYLYDSQIIHDANNVLLEADPKSNGKCHIGLDVGFDEIYTKL
jgi:GGDEF domain-containing protein